MRLIRICLALAILPLLFRLLGETNVARSFKEWLRRGFFAVLGALVFFSVTDHWLPDTHGNSDQGRAFEAYSRGYVELRTSRCPQDSALPGLLSASSGSVLDDLGKAARLLPESASFQRTYGIALAAAGKYAAAVQVFDRSMDVLSKRAPDRANGERAIWHRFFAGRKPTVTEVEAAGHRLERFSLGWLGDLALEAAYERIGPKAVPAELRNAVSTQANSYLVRVTSNGAAFLLLLPQLGIIAFVVGIVFLATQVLRPAEQRYHAVSAILWEAFILMMALHVAPVLWMFGGTIPAPETQPGTLALLLVVGDFLEVLAVLYLWWRLAGKKLSLSEVGLTARHLGANILIGAGAAVIMMPLEWVLAWVTELVSNRYFPHVAPPYHPLMGLTATAVSPLIRAALFFGAAIGAPLVEETFFRGVLFGALRRRLGFWAGLLWSSAFFAALHPQLPLGFLPIALLGATFCALYEWRQSLVPGMVAHAVNNGLIFLFLGVLFPASG